MDRLCCCDDKGHAGRVVGLAAVTGEASGLDVMLREVKIDTAGRRSADRLRAALCTKVAYIHIAFIKSLCKHCFIFWVIFLCSFFKLSSENKELDTN